MRQLLTSKAVIVCAGPGGVGKTTTAAAAGAIAALETTQKVLVLTVDPARRLAGALGMDEMGNAVTRVPDAAFEAVGVSPRGELWGAMLDTKQAWDDLVRRHAPNEETARRIFANALYENVSGRFIQSHDYIAAERLYELHHEGGFDLIIVDTPPARHAIDFLEAPARMAEFFSSRLLRWLLLPYTSRLAGIASRPFTQVADKILGAAFLSDVGEFFRLFQAMYGGFVSRAKDVSALLSAEESAFVVISTLEHGPRREAESLVESVSQRKLNLGGVVINKVLPPYFRSEDAKSVARQMASATEELVDRLAGEVGAEPLHVRRVLEEVGASFLAYASLAASEATEQQALGRGSTVLALIPHMERDVFDLPGLVEVGRALWDA